MAELFDNSIEPAAIGFSGQGTAEYRNLLIERSQNAEYILRARIATVTTEGYEQTKKYNVTLKVAGEPLGGTKPPSDTFTVVLTPADSSYRLVRSRDLQLVGTPVIALMRRFTTREGKVLRWYLAPDSQQTIDLVKQGQMLSRVAAGDNAAAPASASAPPAR